MRSINQARSAMTNRLANSATEAKPVAENEATTESRRLTSFTPVRCGSNQASWVRDLRLRSSIPPVTYCLCGSFEKRDQKTKIIMSSKIALGIRLRSTAQSFLCLAPIVHFLPLSIAFMFFIHHPRTKISRLLNKTPANKHQVSFTFVIYFRRRIPAATAPRCSPSPEITGQGTLGEDVQSQLNFNQVCLRCSLQGADKTESAQRYGADVLHRWNRSYDEAPPAISTSDPRWPGHSPVYR